MEYIIIALLGIIIIKLFLPKPAVDSAKQTNQVNKIVLDSCALIDGRVIELAKLGFLPGQIVVPEFVVNELQFLADGRDAHKRERSRFGLSVVRELQNMTGQNEVIIDKYNPDKNTVDEKLVVFAKHFDADLYTTDFNLNQVAAIHGVRVLNVNELSHAIRPMVLPGETIHIVIKQSGTNKDQGVGYLEDGTMVVVDHAIRDIGKKITAEITKSHQTVAGKMLFAKKIVKNSRSTKR